MDLAGPFGQSSGGAKYVMQTLDHHTNYGWICFLRERSGTNVVAAFRAWYASIKSLLATHGGLGCVLTDNGTEWVNAEFRGLLAELNITRELTAVDGPKSNGRVERRIALVMEGGKAAFLEFPKLFPGVMFPTKALSFRAIWPEAFAWMNDSLNIAAERGTNVISAKWVYSRKGDEFGYAVRAKARLVARGFAQREGVDFFETFSPCPSITSIRLLAAIACVLDWDLCHFDAEQAFVQSELDEVVFIRLHPGCGALSGKVVRLRRSLYGLKQASRTWHHHLTS
ncbi:unnamed protein product [Ectocarpus sp. CCAP 1310/34]|nr:unnamed protein product [Ectocarpus sp. CCAP 1310/34]